MTKNSIYILLLCFILSILYSQTNQDARMLGLNGSYTTLAQGYRSVGINPANLAVYNQKSFNILDFSMGINNNFFSIQNYNALSGAHLDDTTCVCYYPKDRILSEFGGRGLRVMQSLNFPFPFNISNKSYAFTSRLITNIDLGLPDGMVRFLLSGNPLGEDRFLDIEEFIMMSQEIGFSYGYHFTGFSAGLTIKYLLGLFYMGMEPINNTSLITNTSGFIGNPTYLIQQAIGGGGLGLDIGFTADETNDGYRFGFSIINLLGTIKWTQNHFLRSSLENTIKNSTGDYYLRQNEFILINFVVDSLLASSLNEDKLIYYGMYKVIPLDSIPTQGSTFMVELEDGTYLYPSGGNYKFVDILGNQDKDTTLADYWVLDEDDENAFRTRQPIYFRFGVSKRWDDQAVVAWDLVTGFSNRYGSSSDWRFSFGAEITRFENKLLRLGYGFGGINRKSISFGYGMKIKKIHLDFALSFNGGFSLNTLKGLDLSTGIIWMTN